MTQRRLSSGASGSPVEVLMGERTGAHQFLPHRYVFPGGRVDGRDAVSGRRAKCARRGSPARANDAERPGTIDRRRCDTRDLRGNRVDHQRTGSVASSACTGRLGALFRRGIQRRRWIWNIARAITPVFRPLRFDALFLSGSKVSWAIYRIGNWKTSTGSRSGKHMISSSPM